MSKGKLLLLLGALCSVTVQAMRVAGKPKANPVIAMNKAKDDALAVLNDDAIAYSDKQLAVAQAVAAIAAAGNSAKAVDVQNRGIAQGKLDGYVADYIYGLDFASIPVADKGAIEAIATQIVDAGLQNEVIKHINKVTFSGSTGAPSAPHSGGGSKGGTPPPPPPVTIQSLFNDMLALDDANYMTDGDTQDWIQGCDNNLAGLGSSGDAEQEAMITAVYDFYNQAKLLPAGKKLPFNSLSACAGLKDSSALTGSDKQKYTVWYNNNFEPWARTQVQAPTPPPPPSKKKASPGAVDISLTALQALKSSKITDQSVAEAYIDAIEDELVVLPNTMTKSNFDNAAAKVKFIQLGIDPSIRSVVTVKSKLNQMAEWVKTVNTQFASVQVDKTVYMK